MTINSSKYFDINKDTEIDYLKDVTPKIFDEGMSIMECAYIAIMENETNWNRINSTIALNELNYLKENGQEIIYEATGIKDIIDTIIKAVKFVFSKIMGLLDKAKAMIDKKINGNKIYLNANYDYIRLGAKNIPADAEYIGYDCNPILNKYYSMNCKKLYEPIFKIADEAIDSIGSSSDNKELVKNLKEKTEELLNSTVKELTDDKGDLDSFYTPTFATDILGEKKNLFEKDEMVIRTTDIRISMDKHRIGFINKESKDIKKVFNTYISKLKKYEKNLTYASSEDQQDGIAIVHAVADEINKVNSFCTALIATFSKVNIIDLNQSIQIVKKLIEYGKKAHNAGEESDD